jgi:hypothetical protein
MEILKTLFRSDLQELDTPFYDRCFTWRVSKLEQFILQESILVLGCKVFLKSYSPGSAPI